MLCKLGGVLGSTSERPRDGVMELTGDVGVVAMLVEVSEDRLLGDGGVGSHAGTEAGGECKVGLGMEMGKDWDRGAAGCRSGGLWDRLRGVGGDFGGEEGV